MKNLLIISLVILVSCENSNKIMKHPLDNSQVRTVVLENGLKVYLLSDPKFNVSSASVAVEVGSLDNPKDREGLAHFLNICFF